jgi:hemolysin III
MSDLPVDGSAQYGRRERKSEFRKGADIAAAIIHGAGVLFSVAALIVLVVYAASRENASMTVGVSLWGAALIYRFLSSTLSHALKRTPSDPVFRAIDHTGEYFLVASSFAPFCLSPKAGAAAYLSFGLVWVAAVFGVISSSVYFGRFRSMPLTLVVALAWLVALALPNIRADSGPAYFWILGGWFAYLIGTIFYAKEKTVGAHLAWHSVSLAASVCLFFGTYPALANAY